ncbi:MAG: sigma-70 family RNA polymerase sigma factor [Armatimonadetes bacterium]|nr:sigma-70 family RNA polymerase sigma factor [Armatimonadota bacterium]MCX7968177.1 sigma-70 family RNA polymerase sigma factor [Armatimonadota bacterium]MDW8143485.1 sigma-70 family RNA polymerase sigma factor [Armatimonadota bacterium]
MARDELPDSVLVAKAKRGDWVAFEQLFWRYHERIYTFIWHFLQNREASEDLTQETFVRAWESLHGLKSNDAFQVWLHQIARRLCLDALRKRAWEKPMSDIATYDDQKVSVGEVETDLEFGLEGKSSPEEIDPEETLFESERKKAVRIAVSKLSQPLREVVVLHYFEGLPVDEISKVLGVPIGTVLSRLARARESLRKLLAHYLDEVENEVNRP